MKNKLSNRDLLDIGMLSCIFAEVINGFITIYLQSIHDNGKYVDNYFTNHDFPLHANIGTLIGACFFLFRILRFNSCICTKVITIAYFLDQLFTTFLIFTGYNEKWYFNFIYPLYFIAISGLFIYLIVGKILIYYKLK